MARRSFLQHSLWEVDGDENCIAHVVPRSVMCQLTQCLNQCRRGLGCASWVSYTRDMHSDLHRTFDVYAAGSLYIGLSSGICQLTLFHERLFVSRV